MNIKKWIEENARELTGKVIAVTGSTGGLGRELCDMLAGLGASLILLDRSPEKSLENKKRLLEKHRGISVNCITLDLEELWMADKAVEELCQTGIDVFIHNAGAYSIPRHKCKSGYDNVFQINFATPYYMIKRLLPHLRERGGRVVAVGSIAHNYSLIDEGDVDFSKRQAHSKVYGNAKRYLMFALHGLFKDEKEASLAIVHPGITFTNITAHYPKLIFAVIKHPMKVIFMKPRKAALCLLAGVFEETEYCRWTGPRFFNIWGRPRKKLIKTCSAEERSRIFSLGEEVYEKCALTVEKEGTEN